MQCYQQRHKHDESWSLADFFILNSSLSKTYIQQNTPLICLIFFLTLKKNYDHSRSPNVTNSFFLCSFFLCIPFSYFLQHILKNIYFVEHQSISHAEFTKVSCPFFKFYNNWHFLKKWKYTLFVTFQMVNLSYSQSLSCFLFIKVWNCNSKCIYEKSKDLKSRDELKGFCKIIIFWT